MQETNGTTRRPRVSGPGGFDRRAVLAGVLASPFLLKRGNAAETLNAYSIWPENYARPMLDAFEKQSGIHVNFVRFSSGEALARVIAEKGNPQIDVLFGGPEPAAHRQALG